MANASKTVPQIADDEPDVARVLLGLRKTIYSISDIVSEGPHGRTLVYEHRGRHP